MPGAGVKGRIERRFGPLIERIQRTTPMRAFERYRTARGNRLAAAITYSAFLSLFPLLAVSVAITAAVLGESGIKRLRDHLEASVPGLAERLPIDGIVHNAATIGVVSGVLLVWTGLSWVNAARGGLRTIWAVDDMPGGFIGRKLVDLVALIGLGITAAVSIGASVVTVTLAGVITRRLGMANSAPAQVVLWIVGTAVGLAASTVLFAYLLAGIPRLRIPHGVLLRTALVAAVLFEVTKGLVAAYVDRVAGRTLYGAFGVPVAVLLWFDITFQALLLLSAWTATVSGHDRS